MSTYEGPQRSGATGRHWWSLVASGGQLKPDPPGTLWHLLLPTGHLWPPLATTGHRWRVQVRTSAHRGAAPLVATGGQWWPVEARHPWHPLAPFGTNWPPLATTGHHWHPLARTTVCTSAAGHVVSRKWRGPGAAAPGKEKRGSGGGSPWNRKGIFHRRSISFHHKDFR